MKTSATQTAKRQILFILVTITGLFTAALLQANADTLYVSADTGIILRFDAATGANLGVFASGLNGPDGFQFLPTAVCLAQGP